jgi:arylsulfatase
MDFTYDGGGVGKGGTATLMVDGTEVGTGRIEKTVPIRVSLDEGLDVGEDTGTPVNLSYDVPFKFTGTISQVTVELKGAELTPTGRPKEKSELRQTKPNDKSQAASIRESEEAQHKAWLQRLALHD